MKVNVYTVSQINNYIKRLLENDVFLSELCIEGEISNFKFHSSGHLYFSLKDETGSIDCIMFRSYAQKVDFTPENGMKVIVGGYISLYEKTGKYQLYATYIQPAGLGELFVAFEKLKNKLSAEGLFNSEFKRPICEYPKTVAVVTSPTGAAVRDIINVSKRRNSAVKIVVVPVLVQGQNAAADIAEGIEKVNLWGQADTIIVGRGGGSMEDLWAFNEEIVARAIFNSKIPVISAVGHEVDFTIADFVADLRAATPSAAAEIAVPAAQNMEKNNIVALRRINRAMNTMLHNLQTRFDYATSIKAIKRPLDSIYNYQILVEHYYKVIEKNINHNLSLKDEKLKNSLNAIENLSPINVIKRGYSLAYKEDEMIKSVHQVKVEDKLKLSVGDGDIFAIVSEIMGR